MVYVQGGHAGSVQGGQARPGPGTPSQAKTRDTEPGPGTPSQVRVQGHRARSGFRDTEPGFRDTEPGFKVTETEPGFKVTETEPGLIDSRGQD